MIQQITCFFGYLQWGVWAPPEYGRLQQAVSSQWVTVKPSTLPGVLQSSSCGPRCPRTLHLTGKQVQPLELTQLRPTSLTPKPHPHPSPPPLRTQTASCSVNIPKRQTPMFPGSFVTNERQLPLSVDQYSVCIRAASATAVMSVSLLTPSHQVSKKPNLNHHWLPQQYS